MHFHRRRIGIAGTCSALYGYTCYKTVDASHELLRMAVAGSIANFVCESGFHFVDTVNVRVKVSDLNESSLNMVKKIYAKEGLYGFSKGFSACFYGSIVCGFIYFSLYKVLKQYCSGVFSSYNVALTFFVASFAAEMLTLFVYYPYDLIKCRLQSKNYLFKYKNLVHAFQKEFTQNGLLSLY